MSQWCVRMYVCVCVCVCVGGCVVCVSRMVFKVRPCLSSSWLVSRHVIQLRPYTPLAQRALPLTHTHCAHSVCTLQLDLSLDRRYTHTLSHMLVRRGSHR
jgi:hypothetical protein